LVNVDAIAFELGCFGVSGASTLLPFCVKDWVTIVFCSRIWGASRFLDVLESAAGCNALAFSASELVRYKIYIY
jgi:hypothetical protein